MFQNVEYVGFEAAPEVRLAAESATVWANDTMRHGADRVRLVWHYGGTGRPVTLEIYDAWAGRGTAELSPDALGRRTVVREVVRDVHSELLARHSAELIERMKEDWAEPAGV